MVNVISFSCSLLQREALDGVIHVRGCIHAVNLWMGDNIGATIGICCAVGLPQLLGILLSCVFWNLLVEMSESQDMVDFKFLKRAGYKYSELDLSGAGWCMCLPREEGYLPVPVGEPDTWAPDPIPYYQEQEFTHSQLESKGPHSGMGMDEVDNRA